MPVRIFDLAFGIANPPANGVLVVDMGCTEPFEACEVGFKSRLRHQARIDIRPAK